MKFILAAVLFGLLFIASGGSFESQAKQQISPKKVIAVDKESIPAAKQKPMESSIDPVVATVAIPPPAPELTSNEKLLEQAGIPSPDWSSVNFIFQRESTWRPAAINSIGCIGLGQSCPGGSGLAAECPDWQTDSVCQIKHFDGYAKRRYGSWLAAVQFWQVNSYW